MPEWSNSLFVLFSGGGVLALLGTLLTNRSGRQRDFDQRVDRMLTDERAENVRLEARLAEAERLFREKDRECREDKLTAEAEHRFLALENTRLRRVLIDAGIDPDPSVKGR